MSRAIVSFAHGKMFEELAEITFPRMEEYARRHGLTFVDMSDYTDFSLRPASWMKIPVVEGLLKTTDDEVLWIDCDVWIKDLRYNIFEGLHEDSWHGMVLHHVGHWNQMQWVPNCGVWVLRKPMIDVLKSMWECTQYINHVNWEQAALIHLMGGWPDNMANAPMPHWKVEKTLEFHTTWLDYRWNQHPMDVRRFDPSAYFWHCTMFGDRLKTLQEWSENV